MSSELTKIVADFPRRIQDKFKSLSGAIKVDDHGRVKYNGYTLEFDVDVIGDAPKIVITLSRPEDSAIGDLPTIHRLREGLQIGRRMQATLNLTSARVNRATNYVQRGEINYGSSSDNGLAILPREVRVTHPIMPRKEYNPTELFQAVWDLGIRPIMHLSQNYPLS